MVILDACLDNTAAAFTEEHQQGRHKNLTTYGTNRDHSKRMQNQGDKKACGKVISSRRHAHENFVVEALVPAFELIDFDEVLYKYN